MSDNMLDYGTIEELWNLGCTTKTIANITKQPLWKVENTLKHIKHNRDALRGFKVTSEEEYKC